MPPRTAMYGKQLRKFGENLQQKGNAGFTETRYCLFIFACFWDYDNSVDGTAKRK